MVRHVLFLSSLLSIVLCDTFSIPAFKNPSSTASLLRSGQRSARRFNTLRRFSKQNPVTGNARTGSQPFIDYYDDFYLGNITVGTPPQTMTLVLDTGSSDLWVIDSQCNTAPCTGNIDYRKHKFNTAASTTFRSTGKTFSIQYGLGDVKGQRATDTMTIGGFAIATQTIGVATQISQDFQGQPMDGILGLAWPDLSVDKSQPPMQSILPQLTEPIFTVWLDRKLEPSEGGLAGLITYGAFDAKNCDSNITYTPLSVQLWWQFPLDKFTVGGYSDSKTRQAISDTGTSWMGCPDAVLKNVVKELGAAYDSSNELYTLSCDKMKHGLLLYFVINGQTYSIPPYEYLLDLGLPNNRCVLTFFSMSSNANSPEWILGDTWIRTYCNVYDIGQKRMGFARALHNLPPGYDDSSASKPSLIMLLISVALLLLPLSCF